MDKSNSSNRMNVGEKDLETNYINYTNYEDMYITGDNQIFNNCYGSYPNIYQNYYATPNSHDQIYGGPNGASGCILPQGNLFFQCGYESMNGNGNGIYEKDNLAFTNTGGGNVNYNFSNSSGGGYGKMMQTPGVNLGLYPSKVAIRTVNNDEYIYVNSKQYLRILHRREKRKKLNMNSRFAGEKPKYLHESRHVHAMTRQRGKGGRFVSKKDSTGGNFGNTGNN